MPGLEVIAPDGSSAEVPMLDTPEEFLGGIRSVVAKGASDTFTDFQFVKYYGPIEQMRMEEMDLVKAMRALIEGRQAELEKLDDVLTINFNIDPRMAIRVMSKVGGKGGMFFRFTNLFVTRYLLAPSRSIQTGRPEVDLAHMISFDGGSLVVAMVMQGFEPEVIATLDMPDELIFRERAVGEFILGNLG